MTQQEQASNFRAMHRHGPLVLPNAWDAASARLVERAGARAVATTSAGVSWALGRPDGEQLRRDEMLDAVARIVRAVSVPVSADVESGYGDGGADDVARTVRAVIALGVAGINLEDAPGPGDAPLLRVEAQVGRIAAARAAAGEGGADLVINARTDTYLRQVGAPEERFDETVRRARAYRAAGADCVFVPGVVDEPTIAALVGAVDGPVNVMAGPGAPAVARLAALGVARVSVGPAIAQAALAATWRAARELLDRGTYGTAEESLPFGEANALFAPAPATR